MQQGSKNGRRDGDGEIRRTSSGLQAIPTVVANDNSSAAIRYGVGWTAPPANDQLDEGQTAEKKSSRSGLFLLAGTALLVVTAIIVSCPTTPNAVAGLSMRQLATVLAIVFLSGVMSGLSGFGFSAIGAVSLLIIPPLLQVPLFQALSKANQLVSIGQLRQDMPRSMQELWRGPGPCMIGGIAGVPIGVWLLAHLPATQLMTVFGVLLTFYSIYSLFKPSSFKLRGCDGPAWGILVGFLGGAVGGFTAFPGAVVVVWIGLRGVSKEQQRAIVQPYIIMAQIYSLVLLATLHTSYFSSQFWLLLLLGLPVVIPGTLTGLAIYRHTSDINFKRISFLLLGLSGFSLLAKTCGPLFKSLFGIG